MWGVMRACSEYKDDGRPTSAQVLLGLQEQIESLKCEIPTFPQVRRKLQEHMIAMGGAVASNADFHTSDSGSYATSLAGTAETCRTAEYDWEMAARIDPKMVLSEDKVDQQHSAPE